MTEKPDLTPEQSQAWDLLEQGATRARTAAAVGRAKSTIDGWVTNWRRDYDADLFRKTGRPPPADPDDEDSWDAIRSEEARNSGVTASLVRQRITELLTSVGQSRVDRGADGKATPIVVPGVPAQDVKALADAAGKLIDTAELLRDGPNSQRRRVG